MFKVYAKKIIVTLHLTKIGVWAQKYRVSKRPSNEEIEKVISIRLCTCVKYTLA